LSDRRLQRLSNGHFRAFVTSLVWSVNNRTDGVIEPEDLNLIPNFAKDSVKTFLGSGLWAPREAAGRGWLITDFETTQTTSAQLRHLDQKRAKEREKKARQRAAGKADADGSTGTDAVVPGDIRGDVPPDCTGQDRTGQDRQGGGEQQASPNGAQPAWRGVGPDPFNEYK
jgi:hypothetical protein